MLTVVKKSPKSLPTGMKSHPVSPSQAGLGFGVFTQLDSKIQEPYIYIYMYMIPPQNTASACQTYIVLTRLCAYHA